ncbi:MAG: mechanosensitive ion channel family protein [Phormidesmis sp.]
MSWNSKVIRKLLIGLAIASITTTSVISLSSIFEEPILAQDLSAEESVEVEIPAAEDAEVEEEPLAPVTAGNATLPLDELEILLNPLPAEQVQAEADAWVGLLQDKAQDISDLELEIQRRQGEEIDGDVDTDLERGVVAATELEVEQSELISRLEVVLNNLDEKGGETTSYRQYMGAVSGIQFDITDAQSIGLRFMTWLQSEQGGIRWGFNLLKVIGISLAALLIAPRIGKLMNAILEPIENISELFRRFIVKVTGRAAYVIAALLALASIGVNLGPLLALLGGLSFILAFALQSNLGNFASGLMLLLYKPFDVDDEVEIAGHWAVIKEITLANTLLQVWGEGRTISIPNAAVWGGTIVNHTPKDGVRKICEKVCVNINEDMVEVKRIIEEVLLANPLVLKEDYWAGTFVWQVQDFGDVFYVARCKSDDYWTLYEELVLQIYSRLREAGIAFAVPEYRVSLDSKVKHESYSLPKEKKQLASGDVKQTQELMGLDIEAPA